MWHYASGSRRIVPIRECPVHADRGNRIAFALRDALVRGRVPPRLLRHVLVRTTLDEGEAVAMLIVRSNDPVLRAPVRAFLASAQRPDGFFLNLHDGRNPFLVGRTTIHLAGRRQVLERGLGPSFLVSPTAFFPPNVAAARSLLALVLEGVGDADPVLDLYAGGGLFGVPLAQRGVRVVAVEENPSGIQDLLANLRANGIPPGRVRGVTARVETALGRGFPETFEAVVLDPPRAGCAPGVVDAVFGGLRPARAVYVSCNPQALAEDLPRILDLGYRVVRAVPVDMFPHTDHVETVVSLARA
jgi:23S rRNA (uracil1939-C5)-methyltransferase